MGFAQYLLVVALLRCVTAVPQINLHHTDWVNESVGDDALPHHCLRLDEFNDKENVTREIMMYCLSELPSRFGVEANDLSSRFTFTQLAQQSVTSEQLYLWSAPIDIIEEYQTFLNELLTTIDPARGRSIFYNCTLPKFGSTCQYELEHFNSSYSTLYDMINTVYSVYEYSPTTLTCYVHLQCHRGHPTVCLDWTDICNEQVDCVDGGMDEADCWQLEVNECEADEYRCRNGQCISKLFVEDEIYAPDCVDRSDEVDWSPTLLSVCHGSMPTFACEDAQCRHSPLTFSCLKTRERLLFDAMNAVNDNTTSTECRSAFHCLSLYVRGQGNPYCRALCANGMCYTLIEQHCPPFFYVPSVPMLFGDVYFAYEKYKSTTSDQNSFFFPFVCYNHSRYDPYFANGGPSSVVVINNVTCHRRIDQIVLWQLSMTSVPMLYLSRLRPKLWQYHETYDYPSTICNQSNTYQCSESVKCISRHRLMNDVDDCPFADDENATLHNYTLPTEMFIELVGQFEVVLNLQIRHARTQISFQTICDGFVELLPILVDGRNETDETECEHWICNNTYTRCNGLWNCLDGADEVNCDPSSPTFNYTSPHHRCVSPETNLFMDLPIDRANDGVVDCLGALDEPTLCREEYPITHSFLFHCRGQMSSPCITSQYLCDCDDECVHGDDQQFCSGLGNSISCSHSSCWAGQMEHASDIKKFMCEKFGPFDKPPMTFYRLDGMPTEPEEPSTRTSQFLTGPVKDPSVCHRGIGLRVRLNGDGQASRNACLCPPSYYGEQCQYQNQRVSLSLKFKIQSNSWQTPFAIVVLLVDDGDEHFIHSHEQLTYLSRRDCDMKFQLYLTYSQRPKNETKNYAVQVHIYEKISLRYRASLFFPMRFNFLPVHRLALLIDIPRDELIGSRCSPNLCVHGECLQYSNGAEHTFCRCFKGWSGRYCTIAHAPTCSPDSLHVGVSSTNRSICVCPLGRFGPRCLLVNAVCRNGEHSPCENGGHCIPADEHMTKSKKFSCLCREGFTGDRCQHSDRQIVLRFDNAIALTQSIFVHFIEVVSNAAPVRSTTFRTIPVQQDSLVLYWSRAFHLIFIELSDRAYYLALAQTIYNHSAAATSRSISASDRCPHVRELFNASVVQLHPIRRIKYYHLPCQQRARNLSCFYDDFHLCLCYDYGVDRLSNCFEFDHQMTFDCAGQSSCQNGARCFQDVPFCPTRSMCACRKCFYGAQCQFSTRGFGLSLDAILGYHIRPDITITEQPAIVIASLAANVILVVAGCINGILVLITFLNPSTREMGCGVYLLSSSVATLLTMALFAAKCWILVLTQMAVLVNRTFLRVQCIGLDFLLQLCLDLDEWFNACVAVDRALTAMQGAKFQKKKSKQAAKLFIILVVVVVAGKSGYDPFYRQLIDEENDSETRVWCIANYPAQLKVFSSSMHSVQFFAPFIINLVSAIILISKNSRRQSNMQAHRRYNEILRQQLQERKNLFIAPSILVILALPRLIITFVSKCMKSTSDSWAFLIGYYIMFVPAMLTFLIYVVPSKFYKDQFHKSVAHYRTTIRKRLHIVRKT